MSYRWCDETFIYVAKNIKNSMKYYMVYEYDNTYAIIKTLIIEMSQ